MNIPPKKSEHIKRVFTIGGKLLMGKDIPPHQEITCKDYQTAVSVRGWLREAGVRATAPRGKNIVNLVGPMEDILGALYRLYMDCQNYHNSIML